MATLPTRPFPQGQVIGKVQRHQGQNTTKLTDIERQVLEQAGASPGELADVSSTQAAQQIRNRIDRLRSSDQVGYSKEFQEKHASNFRVPNETDIEELPPAQQQELQESLRAYRDAASQQAPELPEYAHATPGLAEAMLAAQQIEQIRVPSPQAADDDSEFEVTPEAPKPPPPPAASPPPQASAGAPTDERCPRCGFQHGQPVVDVTDEDKQRFLLAIQGGQRFVHESDLLGGRVNVVFRGLTPFENEMIFEELDAQLRVGALSPGMSYHRKWNDYRMVASIARISLFGKPPRLFKPITEIASGQGDATPLPKIARHVYSNVLTTEPVVRIIGQEFARFQRLLETLEVRATDPDFFSGIGDAV